MLQDVGGSHIGGQGQIAPIVVVLAELTGQALDQDRQGNPGRRHRLDQKKARQDPVALREVPGEPDSAALLAADDDLTALQEVRHVLEPDGEAVEGSSLRLRDAIQVHGVGESLRDPTGDLALPDHVKRQHRDQPERRHEPARVVDRGDPVRVAVGGEPEGDVAPGRQLDQRVEPAPGRLRRLTTEQRVGITTQGRHSCGRALEDLLEPVRTGAVHRVHGDVKRRSANAGQVGHPRHPRLMCRSERADLEGAHAHCVARIPKLNRGLVESCLHVAGHVRGSACSFGGLDLEALVLRRIVAGRDDDAEVGTRLHHLAGDRRRWLGPVAHVHREPVAQHDPRHLTGEALGREAAVITHDGETRPAPHEVIAGRLRDTAHVLQMVFPGKPGAPSVGAEPDVTHRCGLQGSRRLPAIRRTVRPTGPRPGRASRPPRQARRGPGPAMRRSDPPAVGRNPDA